MICATRDIILLNRRVDNHTRRDGFYATKISGVSIYDHRESSKTGGLRAETETYKIRIPITAEIQDGRTYMPETYYDLLPLEDIAEHWTIHNEDMVIVCASAFEDIDAAVFDTEPVSIERVEALADSIGFQRELISINSYADNTMRGSDAVKHWRIGGG